MGESQSISTVTRSSTVRTSFPYTVPGSLLQLGPATVSSQRSIFNGGQNRVPRRRVRGQKSWYTFFQGSNLSMLNLLRPRYPCRCCLCAAPGETPPTSLWRLTDPEPANSGELFWYGQHYRQRVGRLLSSKGIGTISGCIARNPGRYPPEVLIQTTKKDSFVCVGWGMECRACHGRR